MRRLAALGVVTLLAQVALVPTLALATPPKLYINEFMAANQSGITDPAEPDEYPDWIEIYNPNGTVVDMAGLYLTDDLATPTKWQFVSGVTIPAYGYLLVYADDDGTQGPLHASFKLSASGEAIGLIHSDGTTVIDSITFGAQTADVSYGRFPDGGRVAHHGGLVAGREQQQPAAGHFRHHAVADCGVCRLSGHGDGDGD